MIATYSFIFSTRKTVLLITILHVFIISTESRNPEDVRPGRHEDVDRFDEVYAIVRNTFLLAAAPAIISFLLNVFRDPDLPLFIRAVWKATKKRLLGSLSSRECSTGIDGMRSD